MSLNPYVAFSTLAVPPRFVGRRRALAHVRPALAGSGSRAVVGMPRVGKSSLAFAARLTEQSTGSVAIEWLDVGTIGDQTSLIHALLSSIGEADEEEYAFLALKRELSKRRALGSRVVVILDEFDAIRGTLRPSLSVRRLRELLIAPAQYGLTCLLVCRRELGIIEDSVPELSNLANACPSVTLRRFDNDELNDMTRRGFADDIPRVVGIVERVSSGVPVLAEEALFYLFEGASQAELPLLMAASLRSVVESWCALLRDLGLWAAVTKVARTSTIPKGLDYERLVDYGLLSPGVTVPSLTFEALASRAREFPDEEVWLTDD